MNLSKIKSLSSKGFTLIELLIVIAIMGVLAAGILVAIDPVDKIAQANDSKVQNDVSAAGRATEAYATTHGGFYPGANAIAATTGDLITSGELKRAPAAPAGYNAYAVQTLVGTPPALGACTAGTSCTGIVITGQLKSKNFTTPGTPVWRYESSSGKSCAVALVTTACP